MLSGMTLGQGRALVVLPGFGFDSVVMATAFEPVFASAEGAAGWQRIYLDLPGTRASAPVEPTSDAVLAAIEQTVLDRLGETTFAVAGHSYGGYLAAGLARRRPGQVSGLLRSCAGVRIERERRDLTGVRASVPEPGWLDGVPESLRSHFEHGVGVQTRAVADRVAAAFALIGPAQEDYLDLLQSTGYRLSDQDSAQPFGGPVALLAGRRDRITGYADLFRALELYPDASYTVDADSGHYLPFERPELFAALTLEWLARVGPVTGARSGRSDGSVAGPDGGSGA